MHAPFSNFRVQARTRPHQRARGEHNVSSALNVYVLTKRPYQEPGDSRRARIHTCECECARDERARSHSRKRVRAAPGARRRAGSHSCAKSCTAAQ
eukprot:2456790-Pleurochrysis_carterae.AAC.3